MGKYFNTLGTSMTLQLVGKSVSIPAKSFATLEGMDEAAIAVQRAVAKGKLRKMPNLEEIEVIAPYETAPEVVLKPVTSEEPKDKQPKTAKPVEKAKEKVENIATTEVSKPAAEGAEKKAQ